MPRRLRIGVPTWDTLISDPGVKRAFDFTTADQRGTNIYVTGKNDIVYGWWDGATCPPPDIEYNHSPTPGHGSIKFTVNGPSNQFTGGEWAANFSPDLTSWRPNQNSSFYVRWAVKFNDVLCQFPFSKQPQQGIWNAGGTYNNAAEVKVFVSPGVYRYFISQANGNVNHDPTDPANRPTWWVEQTALRSGIKQLILSDQDTATHEGISSDVIKLVVQTWGTATVGHRLWQMYRYYPGTGSNPGLWESDPGGDIFQNSIDDGVGVFCNDNNISGCILPRANEWDIFKMKVTLGAYDATTWAYPTFANSEVQLWINQGSGFVQLLDWNPSTPGYIPLQAEVGNAYDFGKLWFGPFITEKDPDQAHDTGYMWVSDIILSTNDILG